MRAGAGERGIGRHRGAVDGEGGARQRLEGGAERRIADPIGRKSISALFAGQAVGIKQISEEFWLVTSIDDGIGYYDHAT